MKAGKSLGIVLALIIVVVIGVIVAGLSNINSIIKQVVESVGTQTIQTNVALKTVDFEITNGRGVLNGLTIANPKGFSADFAVTLNKIALEIAPTTIADKVIVINEIGIDGVALVAEQKDLTNSNLQMLLNNINKHISQSQNTKNTPTNDTKTADKPLDIRLMVEKLYFTNSNIKVITEKWGEKSLSIPDIRLNSIGDKQTGLTPEQLTQAIIKPLLSQAKKAAENMLKDKAKDELKEKISEKLSDKDKDKINALKNLLGK